MKTIPMEQVNAVWDRMTNITERDARKLAQHAQENQPWVMVYLLAMDEHIMDGKDRGRLMELGAIILQVMYGAKPDLRQVTDKDLEAAEAGNERLFRDLDGGAGMDCRSTLQRMVASYNQMPLMASVAEALMCGYEDAPDLAPENTGLAMLSLKAVIDCLDQ